MSLSVSARGSALSRAQVAEVLKEIHIFHPSLLFDPLWVETEGDRDQTVSLRDKDKTDFFTKEIDELLLRGACRIAVHSAKDLPDPLPKGIRIVAVTRGVDAADALVYNELPQTPTLATSSLRREETIKRLYPNARVVDIRGTIEKRLLRLDSGEIDGVVVAEAALIRLQLTHRKRIRLPGETAPLQGRLAIVAREDDKEMAALFSCL